MISLENMFVEDIPIYNFSIESTEFDKINSINKELIEMNSRSTEGIVKTIVSTAIRVIAKFIGFIAEVTVWLVRTVVNKIASFVAWFTRKKEPPKEQSKSLLQKLKSIGHSHEDSHNTIEGVNSLASDIKSYIKSPQDVKNMKPEELVFYKIFLISVNVNDTKYITELFNRQTSLLKDDGNKIDRKGQTLITLSNIDAKQSVSKNNSEEDWLFSFEDDNSNKDVSSFVKMTDVIKKDNRIDLKTDNDYENIINSICRSIYEKPDDSIWLNKLKMIFTNGSKELGLISKNMKVKQQYLEKISKIDISDKLKKNIQEYIREVTAFQNSLMSYVNCINYFTKYKAIRMNLTRRFNDLALVYKKSA